MRRALLLLLLPFVPAPAARDDPPIDRVEEDWELVIRSTDVPAAGPQITTTMSPGPVREDPVVYFNLNYREGKPFRAGGLQVQAYQGGILLDSSNSGSAALSTEGETITWTQKLSISGGSAYYRIESGHSTTWGDFGGDDLAVDFPASVSDLSEYSPSYSLAKSGVGWQADHVSSLKLLRLRYYSGDDLVRTDDETRVVHTSDDGL